jgi:hypothetical protein
MRRLVVLLAAGAIGALAAASAPPAFAKTATECRADYAADKEAIKASGQSEKAYVAACKGKAGPDAAPAAATPAPARAAASGDAAPVLTRTKAQCAAEYASNVKAIKASGQTRAAFDADCRAGTERMTPAAEPAPAQPAPAPAAAAAAPADPMAPKPMMSPAQAAPVPAAVAPAAAKPDDAQAVVKARCPSDRIVWVNTKSGFYDLAGAKAYGKTKPGEYMCEMDAVAAGDRPAQEKAQ